MNEVFILIDLTCQKLPFFTRPQFLLRFASLYGKYFGSKVALISKLLNENKPYSKLNGSTFLLLLANEKVVHFRETLYYNTYSVVHSPAKEKEVHFFVLFHIYTSTVIIPSHHNKLN